MVKNLNLSPEQLKTLKLFSYYCGSYGSKTATMNVYLAEYGTIDHIDSYWYSDSGTRIETYDKISDLIEYIIRDTEMLDYYEYEGNGTLIFEIDVNERKLKIDGYHREYSTNDSKYEWSDEEGDFEGVMDDVFNELGGNTAKLEFNGGGDSGYIDDHMEVFGVGNKPVPASLEDWCYDKLPGGWEINEGSQGKFIINSKERTIELDYEENVEDELSDGTVGYVEF
jgi:hypothetical protein